MTISQDAKYVRDRVEEERNFNVMLLLMHGITVTLFIKLYSGFQATSNSVTFLSSTRYAIGKTLSLLKKKSRILLSEKAILLKHFWLILRGN